MKIGTNTYIHPTAVIGSNVTIGDNCYVGPLCIIGFPGEWKGRENEDKGVYIANGCRLTGLVTIDSGVEQITTIGRNCYLMKHSHIGHDATINEECIISCGAKIGGHAILDAYVNIGLNATIHQKVVIPMQVMIGASSFVGKKSFLRPGYKYAGVPVRQLGPNIR